MHNFQQYRNTLQQIIWQTDFSPLPDLQRKWLMVSGSLTAALKQRCTQFTVTPVFEGWSDQVVLCDVSPVKLSQPYWLREVILAGDQQGWIFARTIIPAETFHAYTQEIQQLGEQPIGEWLFRQPTKRSQLMWGSANQQFARRSMLSLAQHTFLISELFLEDFWRKA